MAADGPVSSGDQQELARRIDELNAKLDEAMAANATAKNVTRVVGVLVALAAVFGVWMIASPIKDAIDNREDFQKALLASLESSVLPTLKEEANVVIKETVPLLQQVAMAQYQAREQEILAKSYNEFESFLTNMTEFGTNEFDTRRNRIETAIIEKLKDEVPELRNEEDAELILANAAAGMNAAVERSLETHFKVHIDAVNNIANNLSVLEIPAELEAMDDLAIREELTNALGLYATRALRTFLNAESREFLKAVAEDPNTGGTE